MAAQVALSRPHALGCAVGQGTLPDAGTPGRQAGNVVYRERRPLPRRAGQVTLGSSTRTLADAMVPASVLERARFQGA
jgi:hypothetical protein